MKVFISQPMKGKTDEEILQEREKITRLAELEFGRIDVIDSFLDLSEGAKPLAYLGESLKLLSEADAAIFGEGWVGARGCKIERSCAHAYEIPVYDVPEVLTRVVLAPEFNVSAGILKCDNESQLLSGDIIDAGRKESERIASRLFV